MPRHAPPARGGGGGTPATSGRSGSGDERRGRYQHPSDLPELHGAVHQPSSRGHEASDWVHVDECLQPAGHRVRVDEDLDLERVLADRLHHKSQQVMHHLTKSRGNWQEAFYRRLAANFGFFINSKPFEQLAEILPSTTLARHKNNILQIEALLMGQAGFLESNVFKDPYCQNLVKEYRFLPKKYSLRSMEAHQWKFLRSRPSNFPVIRLSQFAVLINRASDRF
jgi:hypothetical protein